MQDYHVWFQWVGLIFDLLRFGFLHEYYHKYAYMEVQHKQKKMIG